MPRGRGPGCPVAQASAPAGSPTSQSAGPRTSRCTKISMAAGLSSLAGCDPAGAEACATVVRPVPASEFGLFYSVRLSFRRLRLGKAALQGGHSRLGAVSRACCPNRRSASRPGSQRPRRRCGVGLAGSFKRSTRCDQGTVALRANLVGSGNTPSRGDCVSFSLI